MAGTQSPIDEIRQDAVGKNAKQGKAMVGEYSLVGLALKWDNDSEIRQRMRDGFNFLCHFDPKLKKLTNHKPEKNVKDAQANARVLLPVCNLIRTHKLLPEVERLADEVRTIHSIFHMPISTADARKCAWSIRHFISVIKSTIRTDKNGKKRWPKDCFCPNVVFKIAHVHGH